MTRLLACLLALAGLLPLAQAAAQQLQPLDHIVAVVDEDVILRSELDRALHNIYSQYVGREDQLPPAEYLERQVLERMVLTQLQVARARDSGAVVSEQELDSAIAGIAGQNGTDIAGLRAELARSGMTMTDLRDSVRDEILIQRMRQSFAQGRVSVSEGEVDAALANQQGGGTQYRLAHILVGVPEGASAEQITAAQDKANRIRDELQQGSIDFAAAAVRYSDSPNALEGGDLGWRTIDEIPPSFTQLIMQMQPGGMVGPIRGPSGFQLLQLTDTRQADAGGTITQYRARHILVTGDDAEATARLETLRARIAGGADFGELAREHSEDRDTAAEGGELGWFARDAYGVDFGQQVAALRDGEVSAPFKTQAGWHIVQREGERQTVAADQNRRQAIRESIGQRKLEEQWERFLRELRGDAYVDIRLDSPQPAAGNAG